MDEIHSIGDPTGGEIWERIILLIQCPFIALSATLGNPQTFHRWLQRVSNPNYALGETKSPKPKKSKVNLIEFYERWSDLEKYIYLPENSQSPKMKISDFEKNSGDKPSALFSINPFSAFKLGVCNEENFVMPNLDLSSKDCLEIYDAMMKFIST